MAQETVDVRDRQLPLQQRYKQAPGEAMITDRAIATGGVDVDPFHGITEPGSQDYGVAWEFGVHRAIGGFHDAPNPGDLLCAALATCLDSTIRMIADRLGVTLERLEVEVTAEVDVRGCLVVKRDVPVGFQSMECHVDIWAEEGTDTELMEQLMEAAEYSCVNLQTLRSGVPVETTVDMAPSMDQS
jgi:uncharacterized OsmC-like protein